ncbi:MAG: hypothetical protein JSS49_29290 [Planctomycetes bacterium]|nr:hypothetical protein [Planctomycetota bacterium]
MIAATISFGTTRPCWSEPGKAWQWRLEDQQTGAPVSGAVVQIEKEVFRNDGHYPIRKLFPREEYVTDANGTCLFDVVEPEDPELRLIVRVWMSHSMYLPAVERFRVRAGRRLEDTGQIVPGNVTRLQAGISLKGRAVYEDGLPAANVAIAGFSYRGKPPVPPFSRIPNVQTKTDEDGRFQFGAASPGCGAIWLLPAGHAPAALGFSEPPKDGDFGTIKVPSGRSVRGRVLGSDGKPIEGLRVSAIRRSAESAEVTALMADARIATLYERLAYSEANGEFELPPVHDGDFEIRIVPNLAAQHPPEFEGVFLTEKRRLPMQSELAVFRARPAADIEVKTINSAGNAVVTSPFAVTGQFEGGFVSGTILRQAPGICVARVPKGTTTTRISLGRSPNQAVLVRTKPKAAFAPYTQSIDLGTVDASIYGIEVMQFRPTRLIIKVVDDLQQPVEGVAVKGTSRLPAELGGQQTVRFRKQNDGRWASDGLVPEYPLSINVSGKGWQSVDESSKPAEGNEPELVIVMRRE